MLQILEKLFTQIYSCPGLRQLNVPWSYNKLSKNFVMLVSIMALYYYKLKF